MNDFDAFFKAIPKVDIHCHLYGTIRPRTLKQFAHEAGTPITDAEVEDYYIRGEKPKGVLQAFRFMEEFIFGEPERLYRLTMECLEDMKSEEVRYVELFWNSTGTLRYHPEITFQDGQRAIVSAMREAEKAFGIKARLIHAIDRQASAEDALVMVRSMITHSDDAVVGIGMDYLETGHPPEGFWKAYRMARAAGYKTTAHAGEFGCHWRNVETALALLEVDRLDHGYTMLGNETLVRDCVDRNVIITVIPTNSYYLRVLGRSQWAAKHPIRTMGRRGLKIHPNTDDPTFHNITPAGVWRMMYEDFGYSLDALRAFMVNGLEGAWIDEALRHQWIGEFTVAFDEARVRHLSTTAR